MSLSDSRQIAGQHLKDSNLRHLYNVTFIRFELENPLKPNERTLISLEEKFKNRQEPYPKEIRINEDQ